MITRHETLRHTDHIVVAITMLPGSFDPIAVERIAHVAPRQNVLIADVAADADIAALVRALAESGVGIIDVRRHTADLEGIFRGEA